MYQRQKLVSVPPNIELKPVKVTEFNEEIDEHSDNDDHKKEQIQAKINDHLAINLDKSSSALSSGPVEILKNESKEDEKSDFKVIDSKDAKTGMAIRTEIENKIKTNENVKVCKTDSKVDVQETEDAIIKKVTSKTRTTKSVVKTTTTTTTKKGIAIFDEC